MDGFVLRTIADRVGVKLGNLQYYFATRDDLLEALLRVEFASDLDAIDSLRTEDAEADFVRTVRALMDRWGTADGNIYMPIGVLALTSERFRRLWSEIYEAFYSAMSGLILRLDPTATPGQARIRAIKVTALIDGASFQSYRPAGPTSMKSMSKVFLNQALSMAQGHA